MTRPTSILCFVVDQMRADHLSCVGNPDVRTQNIDALAARGTLFEEAYVANPVCMPNRASLFTGQWPRAHGLRQNGYTLHPSRTVMPALLRESGYRAGCFGKLHLSDWGGSPDDIGKTKPEAPHEFSECRRVTWDAGERPASPHYGFDDLWIADGHGNYIFGDYRNELQLEDAAFYELLQRERALRDTGCHESWAAAIPPEKHYNSRIATRCGEWMHGLDPQRPFFAWCSFPDPHHPYCPPEPWASRHDPARIRFAPRRRPGELADLPPYLTEISSGSRLAQTHDLTEREYREALAHTYGMIEMVDHRIVHQRQVRTADWALTMDIGADSGLIFNLADDPDELHNLWRDPAHRTDRERMLVRLLDETLTADDWYADPRMPPRVAGKA